MFNTKYLFVTVFEMASDRRLSSAVLKRQEALVSRISLELEIGFIKENIEIVFSYGT